MINNQSIKSCFVAGHNGMVGSAIIRELRQNFPKLKLITIDKKDLNLTDTLNVDSFIKSKLPDLVIIAAAKVGGIIKNATFPTEFLHENITIQNNIIKSCFDNKVQNIIFLGSSCIYPRNCKQPIDEDELLTGPLEKTNEAYSLAKISGIKLCHYFNIQYGMNYKCIMPSNLYGQGDNYHPEYSHVIPGLIRRFHEAKITTKDIVKVWGTGNALREFLYVDDLAKAIVFLGLTKNKRIDDLVFNSNSLINAGSGKEISISELAKKIASIVHFEGKIIYDKSKPDGTPRKILNSNKLFSLGWRPAIDLDEGLKKSYEFFLKETNYVS